MTRPCCWNKEKFQLNLKFWITKNLEALCFFGLTIFTGERELKIYLDRLLTWRHARAERQANKLGRGSHAQRHQHLWEGERGRKREVTVVISDLRKRFYTHAKQIILTVFMRDGSEREWLIWLKLRPLPFWHLAQARCRTWGRLLSGQPACGAQAAATHKREVESEGSNGASFWNCAEGLK